MYTYKLPTRSPCDLGDNRPRELSHNELPNLIHKQNTKSKRNRNQPKLNGHRSSVKQILNPWHLSDKDGDDQTDEHAEDQPGIAVRLGDGIRLEDAQTTVSHGEDVAPLEEDERDEVNALSGVVELDEFLLCVAAVPSRVTLKQEEELRNGHLGVSVHVEEEHGVRSDGLHKTRKEVSLGIDLGVDEVIMLMVARRQGQQVEFFFLHDERETQEEIGKNANDDHEECAQGEGNTEEDVEDDGPDLGPTSGGEEVGDDLLEVLEDEATEAHGIDDGVEAIEENKVSSFNGDIAATDNGNSNISGSKRRSIVDAIARYSDNIITCTKLSDDAKLLLRSSSRKDDFLVGTDNVPVLFVQPAEIGTLEEQASVKNRRTFLLLRLALL